VARGKRHGAWGMGHFLFPLRQSRESSVVSGLANVKRARWQMKTMLMLMRNAVDVANEVAVAVAVQLSQRGERIVSSIPVSAVCGVPCLFKGSVWN